MGGSEEFESDVLKSIRAGGDDLNRLLAQYRPMLRAKAERELCKGLSQRLDASDLVQETLLRAAANIGAFHGKSEPEFVAWLVQILQNEGLQASRQQHAAKRNIKRDVVLDGTILSRHESPSDVAQRKEESGRVYAALQQLPVDYQKVMDLRSRGMGFEEIGQNMGRSADSARMLWGRALSQMIELVDNDGSKIE